MNKRDQGNISSLAEVARKRMIERDEEKGYRMDFLPHSGRIHPAKNASASTTTSSAKPTESKRHKAIKNIEKNKYSIPQMMEPFPRWETHLLNQEYQTICDKSPSKVCNISLLYVFDESEAERTGCDWQCNMFEDGTIAIGISLNIIH